MNRLKELRARKRVRQFDLSMKTGIPQSRISFIENELAIPRNDELKKLARSLKCDVKEIFPESLEDSHE